MTLLSWVVAFLAFGRLMYDDKMSQLALDAAEVCRAKLGSTLGEAWLGCVVDMLLERQKNGQADGTDFFPVVEHHLSPFHPKSGGEYGGTSDLLKNLLRNFSCDVADGGSQPLRTFSWSHTPHDPCEAHAGQRAGGMVYKAGFLPAGNDLHSSTVSVHAALTWCAASAECAGFTFSGPPTLDDVDEAPGSAQTHTILYKSSAHEGATAAGGWHAYLKSKGGVDCSAGARPPPPRPAEYTVQVLREDPPVFVVDGFASPAECEHMTNMTLPHMGRSVVAGGGTSAIRRSYSVNMYPDFDDESDVVTQLARRKFAFAREVARYPEIVEGPGQEPVNAVYYKDYDDQYRPHCDGECNGGKWRLGMRVATSLTYCTVADKGGYTLFTKSALKVVPKPGQMLFFGYKMNGSHAMDPGHTEHTGCPLREGKKWIATMWYREGVDAEKNWEYWNRINRSP